LPVFLRKFPVLRPETGSHTTAHTTRLFKRRKVI
jgi:hypothetical protein